MSSSFSLSLSLVSNPFFPCLDRLDPFIIHRLCCRLISSCRGQFPHVKACIFFYGKRMAHLQSFLQRCHEFDCGSVRYKGNFGTLALNLRPQLTLVRVVNCSNKFERLALLLWVASSRDSRRPCQWRIPPCVMLFDIAGSFGAVL